MTDLQSEKQRFNEEKQKRISLEKKVEELEVKCVELQNFADSNAQRFKEQMELNFQKRQSISSLRVSDPGKLDPSMFVEIQQEKKRMQDEIKMLEEDLENEKDNVKNLKLERKEMQI